MLAAGLAGLNGCAAPPVDINYRMRLEAGVPSLDELVRYATPETERAQLVAPLRTLEPVLASALDEQLMQAVAAGDVAATKALLAQGAQANAVDRWGTTPLLIAAREGRLEVVRMLIAARARPDGAGGAFTPLAAAALRGHTQVVQLLLRAGASVNATGLAEMNALEAAVRMNRVGAAAALLRARADTSGLDANGDSLLMVAINANMPEMVTLLLQSGMDANQPDANGLTPLYWARYFKNSDLEGRLLAAGADPQRLRNVVRVSQPYVFGEY